MAWAALGAAALGALAGGMANKQRGYQEGNQSSNVNLRDINDLNVGRSGVETAGDQGTLDAFKQLLSMTNAGPGEEAITANNLFQNDFANQLQALLSNGGMPTSQMMGQANQHANAIFQPQQVALNQQFEDAQVNSNRLAARLGRPGTDPVLRNKLLQEQTRQQTMLNAQKGAFTSEYANQLPQQFMSVGGALSNLRQGLATQAFQNRQSLLTLGQQLTTNERNYRLQAAGRTGYSYQSGEDRSGGGVKGAIGGLFAGAGAMMGGGGMRGGGK